MASSRRVILASPRVSLSTRHTADTLLQGLPTVPRRQPHMRAPFSSNALVHHKAMQVRYYAPNTLVLTPIPPTERDTGNREPLTEIQGLLAGDESLQHLSKGKEKKLAEALVECRATKMPAHGRLRKTVYEEASWKGMPRSTGCRELLIFLRADERPFRAHRLALLCFLHPGSCPRQH